MNNEAFHLVGGAARSPKSGHLLLKSGQPFLSDPLALHFPFPYGQAEAPAAKNAWPAPRFSQALLSLLSEEIRSVLCQDKRRPSLFPAR